MPKTSGVRFNEKNRSDDRKSRRSGLRYSTQPELSAAALPTAGRSDSSDLTRRYHQLTMRAVAGQLTQLERLNVRYNQLTNLAESLGQLTRLQRLSLEDNQLTTLRVAGSADAVGEAGPRRQ